MKATVKGVQNVDYVSKRTNERVTGRSLHILYKDSNVTGDACDSVFFSDRLGIKDVDAVKPGDIVDIEYNNRGFVCGLTISISAPAK